MKLKELRKPTGLNQTETAQKIGISRISYNKYELGQVEPDIQTLCRIADYYGVTLDYLCEHETKNQLNYGQIDQAHKIAHNILQALPDNEFYAEFGRLQIKAEQLGIRY